MTFPSFQCQIVQSWMNRRSLIFYENAHFSIVKSACGGRMPFGPVHSPAFWCPIILFSYKFAFEPACRDMEWPILLLLRIHALYFDDRYLFWFFTSVFVFINFTAKIPLSSPWDEIRCILAEGQTVPFSACFYCKLSPRIAACSFCTSICETCLKWFRCTSGIV